MPRRVKLKLALLVLAGLGVSAGVAAWAFVLSVWAALAVVLATLLVGVATLFTFEVRFDPTGTTLWHGDPKRPEVALTFDDGPDNATADILDALEAEQVRATFFVLGAKAERRPELVRRARAAGHAIGNHGASHRKLHRLSPEAIEREIVAAEATIGEISRGGQAKLLRVPHGRKSWRLVRTARRLGYRLVGWSAGVWDSDRPGTDVIVARSLRALRPGAILLLHDGAGAEDGDRSQTAEALPAIIAAARARGYRLVTVPELVGD